MPFYVFVSNLFRAFAEAILDTRRYFSKHFLIQILDRPSGVAILYTQRRFSRHFLIQILDRASGEAIFRYTAIHAHTQAARAMPKSHLLARRGGGVFSAAYGI